MEKKDIEELMMMEFGELMYAWGSPLGTTVSILEDYENYFEHNSAKYYHYLSSLYILNCMSDNLKWYKEHSTDFLETRLVPLLMEVIHFDSNEKEMQELIELVRDYLSGKSDDLNKIESIVDKRTE